jgi:uncharacterized protein YkwD
MPASQVRGTRTVRRAAAATATAAIIACLAALLSIAPAHATTPDEAWFIDRINEHRQARGLSALAVDPGLTGGAASWTEHMAATGVLAHDGNLAGSVCCWLSLAENVGRGTNRELVWQAFLSSPIHRANIENPSWTHLGVSVRFGGGQLWTTHRFMQAAGAPPPAPPAPPPTAAPAPVIVIPAPAPTRPPATTSVPPTTAPATTGVGTEASEGSDAPSSAPPPSEARVARVLDALHQVS